ncbi:hypothetical protein ZWY2020_059108 [Hordeum vulgare]|nr:hypothetical protein ZWY2020_059108 [Hordeum vulgare]
MRLKLQGEAIVQFDIACAKQREHADSKLEELKQEMELRLAKIEGLKVNVNESDKAAANANAMATETKLQLETAKATIDSLLSEGVWLQECLRSKDIELSESNLKEAQAAGDKIQSEARAGNANEIKPLRMALEVAEMRYQEEKTGIAFEIKTICEMLENVKSECMRQVCDIELKLKSKTNELMAAHGAPTGKVQEDLHMSYGLSEMQPELEAKLMKSITDIAELKANVMDKENAVQSLSEENDTLKSEAGRKEADVQQRLRTAWALEQLDATEAESAEVDAELRRLCVQSDQWRKAAEATAALAGDGNNGSQMVERTESLDTEYNGSIGGKLMGSSFLDEKSPKRR